MSVAKYLSVTVGVRAEWVNPDMNSSEYPDGVLAPISSTQATVLVPAMAAIARVSYEYSLVEAQTYSDLLLGVAKSALYLADQELRTHAVRILEELDGPNGPVMEDDLGF